MAEARLSQQDWVNAGLDALANEGFGALKADVLAKHLGVSRGSFYWHFKDVAAFQQAVLSAWEQRATADIINFVDRKGGDGREKLHRLAQTVFSGDGLQERQIRAWAAQQQTAAAAQERVDLRRIAYVTELLRASGHDGKTSHMRARFLYLTLVGHFSTGKRHSLDRAELTAMVDLLIATK